jgi:hypothetical protein
MVKKKLTLIVTCLLFCFAQGTLHKKKEKSRQNAPAKVEAKAPESKDGKRTKTVKVIDSTAVTQKD